MTRINVVPPGELTGKHLVAEYRELPRVFGLARNYSKLLNPDPLPQTYTMGTGHVRFFYDKLAWLATRHQELVEEMWDRNYNPQFTHNLAELHNDIDPALWNDWQPTPEALAINRARIAERLSE